MTMIELDDVGSPDTPVDAAALRRVYGRFPTGVVAMCAMRGGNPVGLAVSSFNTVSAEPPLVAVCIQSSSTTWPLIAPSPRVGLSVLAADQEHLCKQLAARGVDRFRGASWTATAKGAVLLRGAAAWLECDINELLTIGDHELAVLRVHRHRIDHARRPLVFHASSFHQLAPASDADVASVSRLDTPR